MHTDEKKREIEKLRRVTEKKAERQRKQDDDAQKRSL